MEGFSLWVLLESGHFDRAGYDALFRRQLADFRRLITNPERLQAADRMAAIDWVAYLFRAVQRAGLRDPNEQEEAVHRIVISMLVAPGRLFQGDPHGAPIDARFKAAVKNAISNLRRSRSRDRDEQAVGVGHELGQVRPHTIPARHDRRQDDEWWAVLLDHVRREVGPLGVRLLDRLRGGESLRSLVADPEFQSLGEWGMRRLWERVRVAATQFVRRTGSSPLEEVVEGYIPVWITNSMASGGISYGPSGVTPPRFLT